MDHKPNSTELNSYPSPGWYKRLFASMMASSTAEFNRLVGERKRRLLGGLHGDVLEIGPGTGPNLAYFPRDIRWLGVEPNSAMFPYLQREAHRMGLVNVDLRLGASERLPAADESMDAVVSTQVLCSVRDPARTLQEALRVLKPGGRFLFIEHVAAPRGTGLRRTQAFLRLPWQLFSDGCHIDRETWALIEGAGFRDVQLEHFRLDVPVASPHISGFAIK